MILSGRRRACRRGRIAILVLLAVVVSVLLVQTHGKAHRESGNDLTSYLLAAEALIDGANPYDTASPFPFVYPAFAALAVVPLTWVPYDAAILLWFVAGIGALFFSVRITVAGCAEPLGERWGPRLVLPLAVCLLLLLSPIQNNLLNGQINFLVLLLSVLFVTDLGAGRAVRAAVWLALGIAIKLTPALFLLYLVRRGRPGVALLAAGLAAAACLLPVAVAGPEILGRQLDWAGSLAAGTLDPPPFPRDYPPFGLAGVVSRLFPALAGSSVWLAASTVLILALLGWAGGLESLERRRADGGGAWKELWTAQLYLLGMLLISPFSEKHHLAFLIPAAVLATLALCRGGRRFGQVPQLLLAVFWIALVLGNRLTFLPLHFVAIVTLFGLIAWLPGAPLRRGAGPA